MNATQAARLRTLAATLSHAAGVNVEITIRGATSFTWSFDGRNDVAAEKLAKIATDSGSRAEISVADLGDDCGFHTCVYVEAGAL